MIKYKIFFLIIFLCSNPLLRGQELPPIVKYSSNVYNAGNQNWMISQDENNYLYFANNEGLLEFNGSVWTVYPSPNETIIRSVKVIANKIFTGCYMEFGYWTRQKDGSLKYYSLSKKNKIKLLSDEQIWNILSYDQLVVFQSLSRIYIYDLRSKEIKIIQPKFPIIKSFKAANSIFYQTNNYQLFEIDGGKERLVLDEEKLSKKRIVNIYGEGSGLLIHTQFDGFFKYDNQQFFSVQTEADQEIRSNSIYSSQKLKDGSYAVGTISNGVYIVTSEGKIRHHVSQSNGLTNNTVLSLFEDYESNLWIGSDNGINCINLNSSIRSYTDESGKLGTIYAAILHRGRLYIGTNQGLFSKTYNTSESFQFIEGTKGQVWSLFPYGEDLFCGHDSGTFLINGLSSVPVFNQSGTWMLQKHPSYRDVLIQGNYHGISILHKVNNKWSFKNKVEGYDYSTKFFEITSANELYTSHEYKGVFRIQLDKLLQRAIKVHTYSTPKKGKNAGLIKFNNTIYFASKQGIFKLDDSSKKFKRDNVLSIVFDKNEYTSGKLILDQSNKLWLFSNNYINYFTINKLNSSLKRNVIAIPSSITNSMLGYENLTQLSHSKYLIGTTDGYYIFDINNLTSNNKKMAITQVVNHKLEGRFFKQPISESGDFSHDENNITISFSVPEYNKYIYAEYQYKLEGFNNIWSDWSSKSSVNFKNLPPGDYVFKVRSKIINSQTENFATYTFTINKPWYLTNLALLIYLILALLVGNYINKRYKSYYQKKEQKLIEENNLLLEIKELENERHLMKLKNEQLSNDVSEKSKELAISTMSLIKKDELLSLIKADLKKTSEEMGSRNLKTLINSALNKNESVDNAWNVFKEAFDTADKDFLKKIKASHPTLTPNDLRLCAYLRMNLSSKEIAPLLNISVRSVEIKRYRLRKKMELPHESSLVEYILSV